MFEKEKNDKDILKYAIVLGKLKKYNYITNL